MLSMETLNQFFYSKNKSKFWLFLTTAPFVVFSSKTVVFHAILFSVTKGEKLF